MAHFIEHRKKSHAIRKKIVVIYHAACTDGFSGAWAAWKNFGKKADYFAWIHQTSLPPLKNKEIYFIDICPKAKGLKYLVTVNKRVVVIDHHISAKKDGKFANEYFYALNHSGATLAWKYFYPKKKIPKLLLYAEDMDLWRLKLENSKAVFAYLDLFDFDFKHWSKLASEFERKSTERKHINIGKFILKSENKLAESVISKGAVQVEFVGIKALAVNSPVMISEIGNRLCSKYFPIAIIWQERKDMTIVSLRSNGKVNVARIAEKFGGGGHKSASAFSLPIGKKLPWKRIKK